MFLRRTFGQLVADVVHVNKPAARDAIFLLHGLGLNRECWRPLMATLARRDAVRVRDICALDMPLHGASPDLVPLLSDNGEAYISWADMSVHLRDAVLAWRHENPATRLHCIAHSMSGCVSVLAQLSSPHLFDSLALIEPIILPPPYTNRFSEMPRTNPAHSAAKRRDTFASFEEALKYYSTRDGWKTWNPEALRLHVQHSFVPLPAGGITMRMTRATQTATYCGGQGTRLFERLQEQDDVLPPVTLASGALSWFNAGSPNLTDALNAVLPQHSPSFRNVVLDGLTHMLVFEDDERVADLIEQHIARANAQPKL